MTETVFSEVTTPVGSSADDQPSPLDWEEPALRRISNGEICRKVLHMSPGLLPFALGAIPHPDPLDTRALVIVSAICLVMTALFLALHRVVRRPGEDGLVATTVSYPATILATLFLFPDAAEFAMVVVSILAFGDGSAYIGGKLFGRTKLPWNRDKTWIGTLSFILCAAPIASLVYWMESANPSVPPLIAAFCGTAAALAGALAESLPTRVTDNLRVGLASAVAVVAAHYVSAHWFLT